MSNPIATIADRCRFSREQVQATVDLLAAGATIPFIARYRKEATDSLDEVAITAIRDQLHSLTEIARRRKAIIESMETAGSPHRGPAAATRGGDDDGPARGYLPALPPEAADQGDDRPGAGARTAGRGPAPAAGGAGRRPPLHRSGEQCGVGRRGPGRGPGHHRRDHQRGCRQPGWSAPAVPGPGGDQLEGGEEAPGPGRQIPRLFRVAGTGGQGPRSPPAGDVPRRQREGAGAYGPAARGNGPALSRRPPSSLFAGRRAGQAGARRRLPAAARPIAGKTSCGGN